MTRPLPRRAQIKRIRKLRGPAAEGRRSYLRGDPYPNPGLDRGKDRAFYKGYRAAAMRAEKGLLP